MGTPRDAPLAAVLPMPPTHLQPPDPLSIALSALIRDGALDIHFQPLVEVERAQILGYEALTRGPAVCHSTTSRCSSKLRRGLLTANCPMFASMNVLGGLACSGR